MPATANSNSKIRNWSIYKIVNPNGRVYIGKTCNYPQRLRQYKCIQLKSQNLITRSLIKYGFENHKFEVIDHFLSDDAYVNGKEIFWIRSFMSNRCRYPEQNGMNMTDGGEGVLGIKRSEEFKRAVSDRSRGRKHTDEWRRQQSERIMGNKYNLGRVMSQEIKTKISNSNKGKVMSESHIEKIREFNRKIRNKPVIQLDLNGIIINQFASIKDAASVLKISTDTLRYLITGKTKRPNHARRNFIFKYKEK